MKANAQYQFIFIFLISVFSTNAFSTLVLTAPPRETAEKGKQVYEPIAKMMSEALGEEVVYRHPDGWLEYSSHMRSGKYDIVFDGPHFAAWRIKHLKHTPVARLPGGLDFVVVAKSNNKAMTGKNGILKGSICGLASPNLATVSILAKYQDAITVPKIVEIKGGFKKVFEAYKNGQCDAALLRTSFWKNLPQAARQDSRIIHATESLPNQTVTVSPRVDVTKRGKLTSLLQAKNNKSTDPLLERFSKKAKYFIRPSTSEYNDLEKLLEGVVFGW
ncbi:MAG: phosphate/phosphite/phosphonate ABC transporter substrate-binding protein [Gammaproteobacteria bacterium]|nr:phosphate/phosphite/phosphonate ABC transporter substrate-binding protein [Gammaproteobacteria bacterium]MDH5800044.1 phosphate/phosphite/phosphonate ABC transporter substrate-binding protein [Gammaproteobacteria bacterium]